MDDRACWIGADPGGRDAFGLAIVTPEGETRTFCVSSADEAVALVVAKPLGVGVDAPLWWSSGISSDRMADKWLRKRYRIPSGTVQTANSLRGAALVQGAMFVSRLREKFPNVPVTETHPKALALAVGGWSSSRMSALLSVEAATEHERDAVCAAAWAREGLEGRWNRDLANDRDPSEQDPRTYWLAPINYFWFE